MCMGSPQPPKVKYQGPSNKEIKQQEKRLDQATKAAEASQAAFQQQLQAQIDEANAAAAAAAEELAQQQAAISSNAAMANQTYMVETTQQAPTAAAQTTEAIQPAAPVAPRTASLTIPGRRAPATGLNIGQ